MDLATIPTLGKNVDLRVKTYTHRIQAKNKGVGLFFRYLNFNYQNRDVDDEAQAYIDYEPLNTKTIHVSNHPEVVCSNGLGAA